MRFAVIDIGTNTFHLIIADIVGNEIKEVFRTSVPVKLGEGAMTTNVLSKASMDRGIAALSEFKKIADAYHAEQIQAMATSAVRNALNGADFESRAKEVGITIQVIDGDKEAAYIFLGVRTSGMISGTSLIVDIGGGSTEFIFCNESGILWKQSVDIGAARLMQQFFKSDPLSNKDSSRINAHFDDMLKEVKIASERFLPTTLIGSAGSFKTFSEMTNGVMSSNSSKLSDIDFKKYQALASLLIQSTHVERTEMHLLPEVRRDMIVMAALTVNYVLEFTGITTLKLSTCDLKIGVLAALSAGDLL